MAQPIKQIMARKFLLLLLLPVFSWAQFKTIIQDSETKEPVPYVNISIDGKSMEFNADENGIFTLPETKDAKTISLSAVGYADTSFNITDVNKIIFLQPQPIQLSEIAIKSKKRENSAVINTVKKAKNTWMGAGGGNNGSLMHARFIPYKAEYAATPYIDKIRFTIDFNREATFNVRLYTVNSDGSPGAYLYDENILVNVRPKQKHADINLSKVSLKVPEEGFFVVFEHIAIKPNRLIPSNEDKFPAYSYTYGPTFLCGFSTEKIGWSYKNGKWQENAATPKGYGTALIEITLTD